MPRAVIAPVQQTLQGCTFLLGDNNAVHKDAVVRRHAKRDVLKLLAVMPCRSRKAAGSAF